jgi:hypothetical protein
VSLEIPVRLGSLRRIMGCPAARVPVFRTMPLPVVPHGSFLLEAAAERMRNVHEIRLSV